MADYASLMDADDETLTNLLSNMPVTESQVTIHLEGEEDGSGFDEPVIAKGVVVVPNKKNIVAKAVGGVIKSHKRNVSEPPKLVNEKKPKEKPEEALVDTRDAHAIFAEQFSITNPSKSSLYRMIVAKAEQLHKKDKERHKEKDRVDTKVFEVPLSVAVERSSYIDAMSDFRLPLPLVFIKCIFAIELSAMDMEGIYRLSGSLQHIKELKTAFDKGDDVHLSTESDMNAVSGLLKLFLREMSEPLVSAEFINRLNEICRSNTEMAFQLRFEIEKLPKPNMLLLTWLCYHLYRVSLRSEKNLMKIFNLGIVFSPTLHIGQESVNMLITYGNELAPQSVYDTYEWMLEDARISHEIEMCHDVEELKVMHTAALVEEEELMEVNQQLVAEYAESRRTRLQMEGQCDALAFNMGVSVEDALALDSDAEVDDDHDVEAPEENALSLSDSQSLDKEGEHFKRQIRQARSLNAQLDELDEPDLVRALADAEAERIAFEEESQRLQATLSTTIMQLHKQRQRVCFLQAQIGLGR